MKRSERNRLAFEAGQKARLECVAVFDARDAKRRQNKKRITGKALRIPAVTQAKYSDGIIKHIGKMTADVKSSIEELFKTEYAAEHFNAVGPTVGMDSEGIGSQLRILINRLKSKYDQMFGSLAMGLSPTMTDDLNRASATQTKSAIEDFPNLKTEGAKLTIDIKKLDQPTLQILKASAARSTSFITSIPERYLNTVSEAVYTSITNGRGLADLIPFFEKQDSSITNWAKNTALDQTRKTFNGLNAGRMKKAGIKRGEWIHSGGSQHPRPLHVDFDGQTFDLNKGAPVGDDDGNDVMPGDEPNCRCTFAPVVEFDSDIENDVEPEE